MFPATVDKTRAGFQNSQLALCGLMGELGAQTAQCFAQALAAPRQQGLPLEKTALLGLELIFKLQEQLLLPALLRALPAAADAITLAGRETDLIRDLASVLAGLPATAGISSPQGSELLAVIDGLASLNAARVDGLLRSASPAALPWAELLGEAQAWLERWHLEWQRDGFIEDEEGDPVGRPAP